MSFPKLVVEVEEDEDDDDIKAAAGGHSPRPVQRTGSGGSDF